MCALVTGVQTCALPILMQPIVDETFVVKDARNSAWLPMAIVGLFLLRGIAGYLTDYNMARAGRGIDRDMRVKVLGKSLGLPGLPFDTAPVPSGSEARRVGKRWGGTVRSRWSR